MRGIGVYGIMAVVALLFTTNAAFAQENIDDSFTKFEGNEIKTNPIAQKILDRIEESKKILSQMLEKDSMITEQQRLIDEQRRISQAMLQAELDRMNEKYEEFTPRNAFSSFVSKFNSTHHDIYWEQFEYMEDKVMLARAAKQQVLDDGGTFQEAQREYVKYASMPRTEMIKTIIDLNVKYGFAYKDTQLHYDENGKLPRYDDDSRKICYGCTVHSEYRDQILDSDSNPYVTMTTNTDNAIETILHTSVTSEMEKDDNVQLTIKELEERMHELGLQMVNEKDFEKQKDIRQEIIAVSLEMEKLQHSDNPS